MYRTLDHWHDSVAFNHDIVIVDARMNKLDGLADSIIQYGKNDTYQNRFQRFKELFKISRFINYSFTWCAPNHCNMWNHSMIFCGQCTNVTVLKCVLVCSYTLCSIHYGLYRIFPKQNSHRHDNMDSLLIRRLLPFYSYEWAFLKELLWSIWCTEEQQWPLYLLQQFEGLRRGAGHTNSLLWGSSVFMPQSKRQQICGIFSLWVVYGISTWSIGSSL